MSTESQVGILVDNTTQLQILPSNLISIFRILEGHILGKLDSSIAYLPNVAMPAQKRSRQPKTWKSHAMRACFQITCFQITLNQYNDIDFSCSNNIKTNIRQNCIHFVTIEIYRQLLREPWRLLFTKCNYFAYRSSSIILVKIISSILYKRVIKVSNGSLSEPYSTVIHKNMQLFQY